MVNDRSAPDTGSDLIRALAEARGLGRAWAQFPAAVQAATERAMRPVPPCPGGPLTEPAAVFSPDVPAK